MSDKLGRRDLFRLWRPADRTADRESKTPAGTRQEAPDSTPAGGFSLDGFYAGRATQTSATLPAFEVTVPRGPGAAAANIATTSRGTPELADRPPPPWAKPTNEPLPPGLVPRVRETTCLAYRSICTVCSERCPEEGAIRLEAGRPVVVAERCTGCGSCIGSCPAPINGFEVLPRSSEVGRA